MRQSACCFLYIIYFMCAILFAPAQSELTQEANDMSRAHDEDGDEYIDLVDMTDEELEEMCTSRGFELIREDGQVYTHEDYVNAASECLQIETDLEEILQKNPQILEDVRRESERMKDERDRLQSQLDEMNIDDEDTAAIIPENNVIDDLNETQEDVNDSTQQEQHTDAEEETDETRNIDEATEEQSTNYSIDDTEGGVTETDTTSTNQPIYTFKEITMEVIEQMKADFTKVKKFLIPESTQKKIQPIIEQHIMPFLKTATEQHVKPAMKTIISVAKDMSSTAVDLVKRHVTAFLSKSDGEEQSSAQAATTIS